MLEGLDYFAQGGGRGKGLQKKQTIKKPVTGKSLVNQWMHSKGVPIEPTRPRIRKFFSHVRKTVIQSRAYMPESIRNASDEFERSVRSKEKSLRSYADRVLSLDREMKTMDPASSEYETKYIESLALGVQTTREIVRMTKQEIAKSLLDESMKLQNPEERASLVALAYSINDLPVKVKTYGIEPVEDLMSSEKTTKEVIARHGLPAKAIARKRILYGVTRFRKKSLQPYPLRELEGFFDPVVDWFKDTASEAADSVKNEVVNAVSSTAHDILEVGKERVTEAADTAITNGMSKVSAMLNNVTGKLLSGAGNILQSGALIAQEKLATAGGTEPIGTAKPSFFSSVVVPVGLLAGGVYLIVRLVK